MFDFMQNALDAVLGRYAETCYKGFKAQFPVGSLLFAKEAHWRDNYIKENDHGLNTDPMFRLEKAEKDEMYLVCDYFLVDKENDPWAHSDYGVVCLNIDTNEKWKIPSQWCHKAMEVTKPE